MENHVRLRQPAQAEDSPSKREETWSHSKSSLLMLQIRLDRLSSRFYAVASTAEHVTGRKGPNWK